MPTHSPRSRAGSETPYRVKCDPSCSSGVKVTDFLTSFAKWSILVCMRTHKTYALCHILLLGLMWAVGITALAAEPERLFELRMVNSPDGLVTAEPGISQQALNKALAESEHLINTRSHKLEVFIEENRITAKTGVMAVVMPGGLVYLAWRKTQLLSANEKLQGLQTDMADLRSDILALHKEEGPTLVARFP